MGDMSAGDKIPSTWFTTEHLSPREQFDAWHESISVVFDAQPLAERQPQEGFSASVRAYHLGEVMLSQVEFEGQRFTRDKRRAAADGLDHYLVHLYATGGLVGTAHDRERVLAGGDLQILDLSQPNLTQAKASGTIALIIPRDTLRQALPDADLHGLVLRGQEGAGALLSDYMRSLKRRADSITAADAPFVARATTEMVAACFHSTAETMARARATLEAAILERIQRHIAANLASPDLHPDRLCGRFAISRTQLYRLFEPVGGVAAYIQDRRLARAYTQLSDVRQGHRRIYDIAYDLGFSSEAHFSRLFRRVFGLSPSDVRARALGLLSERPLAAKDAASPDGYEAWVRNLRGV